MVAKIDLFSIRVLTLESALRFAHFAIEEAYECRKKLFSESVNRRQEGQDIAMNLLRTLRAQIMDYQNLRGSRSVRKLEKELTNTLKELSREASELLADMELIKREGCDWWNRKGILNILRKIIAEEEKVDTIARRLKRKTLLRSDYFYAGIDGGASETKCVVSDSDGNILAKAKTGPCFPKVVGVIKSFDSVITVLKKTTKKALKKKGLDKDLDFRTIKFKRVCAGLCGIDKPEDHRRANELIKKYVERFYPNIKEVIIIPDTLIACYGAFKGEPGIIVMAGLVT